MAIIQQNGTIDELIRDCRTAQLAWEQRAGEKRATADDSTPAENALQAHKDIWVVWAEKRNLLWYAILRQEGTVEATIAFIKRANVVV